MIQPDIRLRPLIFVAPSLLYLLVFSREAYCIFVVLHAYAHTHTQTGRPTRRATIRLERNLSDIHFVRWKLNLECLPCSSLLVVGTDYRVFRFNKKTD